MKIINSILILLMLSGCKTGKMQNVRDDFESESLNKVWSADKFLPGAFVIQSENVRSGKRSAMLTINPGDQIEEEKGSILERAELKEIKSLYSLENSTYEYSFSLFMPSDFPVVPVRLVIAQWKQNCSSGDCDPDNPVLAIRYVMGGLFITLQTGPDKSVLFSQKEDVLNRWLDMKFRIRFSRTADGFLEAWSGKTKIIDYKGITAYKEKYGYPFPGVFYFKMGLYRDHMDQPMTIYLDGYSKRELRDRN